MTIRCAAHSFQLLLNDLEATPLVRAAVSTMNTLLEKCDDRGIQVSLKELQKVAGKGEGKLPIKPVDTRCAGSRRVVLYMTCFRPQLEYKDQCNGGSG